MSSARVIRRAALSLGVLLSTAALAPGLGGGACAGCGDSRVLPDSGAADGGDASQDAARDAVPDVVPCVPRPRPSYVPQGWVPWDKFVPCSGMYVPTSAADLPPPLQWEDCGPNVSPPVSGCQRIANPPNISGRAGVVAPNGAQVDLIVAEGYTGYRDHNTILTADVTGNVHSALMSTWVDMGAFGEGYSVGLALVQSMALPFWIGLVQNLAWGGHTEGYVAGRTSSIAPDVAQRFWDGESHDFIIGQPGILHYGGPRGLELLDFDTGAFAVAVPNPAQSSGVGNTFAHFEGGDLFMFGSAGRLALQRRWRRDSGTVDFIGYYDPDHGAGDLGTDGVDMVWLESHGPKTQSAFWTTADYWTSPYANEKKDLVPRRLRSEIPNVLAGDVIKVGCGRAALVTAYGLRVVRLSDGWSWFLPTDGKGWSWVTALGVTCTHVYVRVGYKAATWLARLPVASLGAGDPPD